MLEKNHFLEEEIMQERFAEYEASKNKETNWTTPYVVSGDIEYLVQRWTESKGFKTPCNDLFVQLRSDFIDYMNQIFPKFDFIDESELSDGLKSCVEQTGLFPISLDRVYYQSQPALDITRLIDLEGKDKGLGRRRDAPPLLQQFRNLKDIGVKEVVLVDDVIFSGDLIVRVSGILEKVRIKVPVVCVGIAIKEGVDKLTASSKIIKAVRYYNNVIDEICERDFYPGVPLSGRLLYGKNNIGAPYILPFGNPGKWASIPKEWQEPLSRFCIIQTIKLFEEIEKESGREIRCSDLERTVAKLPDNETRYIDALKSILD